ncbi:MAG: 6-carboxytetrahydropterin synthase, partial [Planctomycetaceae bacterium]
PHVHEVHPCRNVHGHSDRVEVTVRGEADPEAGWVLDYGELSRVVRPVLDVLDHGTLNAVPGLENPTSERLAAWCWERLEGKLPQLWRITVLETGQTRCEYEGPGR